MERFFTKKCGAAKFHFPKNVQVVLFSFFLLLSISCEEKEVEFHYDEATLVNYLSDLMLKESAVEFYELGIRDSISQEMEKIILDLNGLDSAKIASDVNRISKDTKLSAHYFGLVREELNTKLDSI